MEVGNWEEKKRVKMDQGMCSRHMSVGRKKMTREKKGKGEGEIV